MATRSLNSTGRSRITHAMFNASLDKQSTSPLLSLEWDISGLSIESSGKLFLDVSNDRLERRFVLQETTPSSGALEINIGSAFQGRVFRIRLVAVVQDSNNVPIIRAESVPVSFTSSGESTAKSLLVVQPMSDLEVPWRLSFEGGDVVMMVSNKGNLWTQFLRPSPILKPLLVGPIVFQIALRLLAGSDDIGAGLEQWRQLLEEHGMVEDSSDGLNFDEVIESAEQISTSFQASSKALERLLKALEEVSK